MKKLLPFTILILIFLQACNEPTTNVESSPNYSKFDLFVKRFKIQNPKMWTNDITKEEGNDAFKKKALKYFNDSTGLATMPLYVLSINKNVNGKGFIVHMQNDYNYQENEISKYSHIDIFAFTDEKVAKSLVQNERDKYFITKYHNVHFLKHEQLKFITGDRVWAADVDITLDSSSLTDGNSYGNYILKATEIKHI